ncbi:hypothetical protein DSY27_07680 [Lactobacillus helveticus]|nr:hypothetical protein BCM44_03700 [Lactobacillus helveticus]RHX78387.1 hypothetical protein DSY27_07680 [Lactobacillus helveticus]
MLNFFKSCNICCDNLELQAVRQKETQRNASGLSPLEFDAFDETPYVDFSEPPTAELLFL